MHIPGSLCIANADKARELLLPTDEIIACCSNLACQASVYAYNQFKDAGVDNVRCYAGGIVDWSEAGYPIEGSRAPGTA